MLTDTERAVLRALERATVQHRNPSMAEIVEFTNPSLSISTVRTSLFKLMQKGYVDITVRRARSVRQLKPTPVKR